MEVVVDEPNKSLELKCSKPREGGSAVGSLTNGLRSTRRIFLSPTVLSFPIVPFVGVCFSANRGKTSKVVFVQFEVHLFSYKKKGPPFQKKIEIHNCNPSKNSLQFAVSFFIRPFEISGHIWNIGVSWGFKLPIHLSNLYMIELFLAH